MRSAVFLLSVLSVNICLADEADAKAKAALALAKAQRERETQQVAKVLPKKPDAGIREGCFDNLDDARRAAKQGNKPLILWVGFSCESAPAIRDALPEAIHCHLKTYHDDATARLVFPDTQGREYRLLRSEITDDSPRGIRARIGLPVTRPKAIVVED